ncbi:Proteasome activator complex subunit 4 [Orchesella cincta]|uniref:Proteasome activator complex subunit 4 n=1 Tax=Orchesella cincta TaxID=48709 RepID=A0A1D2M8N2_ORCCI|nr:Proteasome activator complex subunit 4 [Orchesella cincta]
MKTCPLNIIASVADILNSLLKKPELLTREDITIPWKPLYETLDRCVFHRKYTLSFKASAKIENVLKETIRLCNVYFEKGAHAEVIAEFRPTLCPTSAKMVFGLEMMKHFLPFLDPDAEEDINKLMTDLLAYCNAWNNHPAWEWTAMGVFATAAWNMPGSFDWTPHLPVIYTRLMKNLELPVHFKGDSKSSAPHSSVKSFDTCSAARLIIATLGNNPAAIRYLKNFLKSLETYYNPSNHGKWSVPLGALLNDLVNAFCLRVKKERYQDNSKRWWYRCPEDKKLTDEDIDSFVKMTSYIVLDFYLDINMCGLVMKNLAAIRPHIIVPAVMEKYSGIVETVTEPRKYMIALRWVTIVLLPMISSRKEDEGYDGRHLVLPFAMSLLPAIDPNDMFKTLSALGCLHGIFMYLPFVDCSSLASEVEDEDEKELCLATACLEDFTLQIVDRVLSLIENRTLENTRMADNRTLQNVLSNEDQSLDKFLWSVFHRIANQSSTSICEAVSSKLVRFALGSTLETEVSGKLFAGILQSVAIVRPDSILPKLIPSLCSSIESLISDEILDDEELDKALLFQLLLLSTVIETSGTELLKYRTHVESMLSAALKLNGKKAYGFTSKIITRCLQSLVFIYPTETRISEANYDDPKYLAIQDWGKSVDPKTVKPSWHIPTIEELEWAKELFLKIFIEYSAKFDFIADATEENEEFNKRLLKYMQILLAAYDGINTLFKFWDQTPVECEDSVADLTPDTIKFGLPEIEIKVPNSNEEMSYKYYQIYLAAAKYLETFKADDTDAFIALMKGFDSLLLPNVESDKRCFPFSNTSTSSVMFNTLNPKKKWTRASLINKAYDLHIKRVRSATCTTWTHSHVEILRCIFKLCINPYAKVRLNAQTRFFRVLDSFGGLISRCIKDFFIEKLQEGVPHDEYKGALYTIIGRGVSPLIQNRWQDIYDLWTAILKSPFSEKNSIIQMMERVKHLVTQCFIYYPLQQVVPNDSKLYRYARELVSKEELEKMGNLVPVDTSGNRQHYANLLNELLTVGSNGNSHWRKQVMASDMLSVLVMQEDGVHITRDFVNFFFKSLVSDHIELRRSSMMTLSWLLTLFKRHYPSVTINMQKDLEIIEGESLHSILQYTSNPESGNEIQKKYKIAGLTNGHSSELYVHKIHYGYESLPVTLKIKRPISNFGDLSDQSASQKIVLELTEQYFTDEDYMKKLMEFWSLEEKGKMKANKRASICKVIARNNGPTTLKLILKYAHEFGVDKDQWKQRCAADVICGIIYGVKLWDEKTTESFWSELKPIFADCLNSVTQETIDFWGNAICYPTVPYTAGLRCNPGSIGELLQSLGQVTDGDGAQKKTRNLHNRDPNKMRFFIEFLRERFIRSLDTAQTTSVDAYKEMSFFDQAISNVQWRGRELFTDTVALVKKHFFETPNPYMNVREQLGRLLAECFTWDTDSHIKLGCEVCPKYEPFVEYLQGNLKNLEAEAAKYQANVKDCEINDEIRKLLLKYKTVLEWLLCVCWESESSIPPCMYTFIPMLCQFESYDPDPEIAQLSAFALSGLARTLVNPHHLDKLLGILNKASELPSWRARLCVLEFLKVFALNNTSVFASSDHWSEEVVKLVLKLLSDRKLEVRESASKILCGFLHCLLIQNPMGLLGTFNKSTASFAKKRRLRKPTPPEEVDSAHSAILGLCAFVDTHPYHVPKYLPDVLVTLTTHLNDPQPIPATIRKCLSNFRRTHHDNWAVHKTMFSEDQLCILTDIFVSPCYYA